MKTLGYVDAVHHGTAAPSTTNIIWFKTNTNDPNTWSVIDILFWDGIAWISYLTLFFPIKEAEDGNPPEDERAIWRVMDGTDFVEYRVWTSASWDPFLPDKLDKLAQAADSAKLEGKDFEAVLDAAITGAINTLFDSVSYSNMTEVEENIADVDVVVFNVSTGKEFGVNDGNSVQNCTNNNQINLGIPLDATANIPVNRPIVIERNGVGKVVIYSPDGVTINGVNQTSFEIKDQFTSCYLRKKGANEWLIFGNVE